jgi:hypothetical protein
MAKIIFLLVAVSRRPFSLQCFGCHPDQDCCGKGIEDVGKGIAVFCVECFSPVIAANRFSSVFIFTSFSFKGINKTKAVYTPNIF